jgi:hypothetical protein
MLDYIINGFFHPSKNQWRKFAIFVKLCGIISAVKLGMIGSFGSFH